MMRTRFPGYCARLRLPLLWAAGALLLGSLLGGPAWAGPAGLVPLAAGMALYSRVGTVRRPPVDVDAPVTGRWLAVNSPADKVPSHGLHAYGQTYAIDLVHEPAEGSRPQFGAGPTFRLARYEVDGRAEARVPANGRLFTVAAQRDAVEGRR
jgi:hypothetical protein